MGKLSRPADLIGSPTFAEPWEASAFALALHLVDRRYFTWEEFRAQLIDQIAGADSARLRGEHSDTYYECWLAALELIATAKGLVKPQDLALKAAQIATTPPAKTKGASGPVKIA
jgi:nitrile hydratase accessory protein